LAEGVLSEVIVKQTLDQYAWSEPLQELLQPRQLFDACLEADNPDRALVCLQKANSFTPYLRLLRRKPTDVLGQLRERKPPLSPTIIPVLLCPGAEDVVWHYFNLGAPPAWLRDLFGLCLAARGSRSDAVTYVGGFGLTWAQAYFAARCLLSAGRYDDLAAGLARRDDPLAASGVAARCGANCRLDFLGPDVEPDVRVRCHVRLLRGMPRPEAEALAERLLGDRDGLEVSALIPYLPQRTKVADLSAAVAAYATKKKKIGFEEKERLNAALTGVTDANRLKRAAEDRPIPFNGRRICSRCGRLIFSEPFLVWACGHIIHERCVVAILQKAGLPGKDPPKCCPLCGPVCATMVDRPFEPPRDEGWSLDLVANQSIVAAIAQRVRGE
jgi:hypothetical protein